MPARPPARPPRRPSITDAVNQQTSGHRTTHSSKPKPPHGHADAHQSLEERVKRDPELLERALRDPGLRSKLPDKYLSKEQLATRRNHQFVANVGDVTQPLTGDSLVNAAQTLTDREFEPLLKDIDRSERVTAAQRGEQQTRAAGYFGGLASQGASTIAGQDAATAAAVQAMQQRAAGATAAVGAQADAARAGEQHDVDVRGAGLDGGALAQMAADKAAATQRTTAEGQAAANDAAASGAAQAAFLRGTAAATAQAGGETQGQIGARGDQALSDLANQRAKLNGDRKGTFTDTLLKMRGNEVDRYLTERGLSNDQEKAVLDYKTQIAGLKTKAQIAKANNDLKARLTGMGLDAKAAQAAADRATQQAIAAGHDQTSASNAETSASTSAANNRATNHQSDVNNRRTNANRDGADGTFSHKDRVDSAAKRDDAISLAQSYKGRRASRATALQLLTEKYGSDYARVAVGAIYDGGAKPHLDSLLAQRYGIHIPQQYRSR